MLLHSPTIAEQSPNATNQLQWIETFAYQPPPRETNSPVSMTNRKLDGFSVTPARSGRQIVRVSLPFVPGTLASSTGLKVRCKDVTLKPDVRVLTMHPGTPAFVRRAIVTFPFDFDFADQHEFSVIADAVAKPLPKPESISGRTITGSVGSTTVTITPSTLKIQRGMQTVAADLIAPDVADGQAVLGVIVEQGKYYLWLRLLVYDAKWPRIIEVRADSLGTIAVQAHIQRLDYGGGRDAKYITWQTARDLGWHIETPLLNPLITTHSFAKGKPCTLLSADGSFTINFPIAPNKLRGRLDVVSSDNHSEVTVYRATAAEKLSHQPAAWRRAEFAIVPAGAAPLNVMLEPDHKYIPAPAAFDAIYASGFDADLSDLPKLADLRNYTRQAILHTVADGDDFGNVTSFRHGQPASMFCLNRLNHCPGIFEEAFRSGNRRLRDVAVNWCNNFYDLSLWWGLGDGFGGTRYPWGAGSYPHVRKNDPRFTWRGSQGCDFCTKGFDSFFYAYEETGDPRMLAALRTQLAYASKFVHTNTGQCRNIGVVTDFMRLYRFTGDDTYLAQATRLWQELKTKLMPNNLFSQSGEPIVPDPPFIQEDDLGYKYPFAKPYIIGYALLGLPDLLQAKPDEPRLPDVISAVARFLAESQNPLGCWSYPHPLSGGMRSSGIENAMQLSRAAEILEKRGEPIEEQLDTIERTLRLYYQTYRRCGTFMGSIGAWERATGKIKTGEELQKLYTRPADRDRSRDYTQGKISLGGASLEQLLYFTEVLNFYLKHRPAERLEIVSEPLKTVLNRIDQEFPPLESVVPKLRDDYQRVGVQKYLPVFYDRQVERLCFPYSWQQWSKRNGNDFDRWRKETRRRVLSRFLAAPPAVPFDPEIIGSRKRDGYTSHKIVFNLTGDSRVLAYLLVPDGQGPHPAVLLLHDHGAEFRIGKEKSVEPWDVPTDKAALAREWADKVYGGRFVGDELAGRGYVCFVYDALNWSDRGGAGFDGQQALAGNILHLGMSFAGLIAHEDLRGAEFLASRPEVDKDRIAAMGHSMGSFRTWQVTAMSDHIAAGVSVCWMATVKGLMVPGNNQTKGQSSFTMTHPGLFNDLDYPDVASLACPKPMLFFAGEQDELFPVPSVREAYSKMHQVWQSQSAGDKLVTRLVPVPHTFNATMQDEAFTWLDQYLCSSTKSLKTPE